MAKELALITARNERNKKKKKEDNKLQLQAPVNTITNTVKKVEPKKSTVNKTTKTTQPTQKPQNNLLQNNNRTTMPTFSPNDNRTVKTTSKKPEKKSAVTVDIFVQNGKYFYEQDGKRHELKEKDLQNAFSNNRSGVIGRIDDKGKFKETNERGVDLDVAKWQDEQRLKRENQIAANKNYEEKLGIWNKAQENLSKKRSEEYQKRGVDLSTQSNLKLNPQNEMLNYTNKEEQTKTAQQKLNERTERQQPLIEETNQQLGQEREAVNKATNEYALAKYLKNYADVENDDIGYLDKTLGTFTTGFGDVFSNFSGDNKYVDENGKVYYLPNKSELKWDKIRNSYGDNFIGKLARFAGDVSHEAGKQAATIGLNAATGGIGGTALYFSDIAADMYKQNINEGYSEDKALIDSMAKAGQNYIKQRLIGGLGGKLTGTGPSWLEKSLNNQWAKAVSNPVFSRTLASMSAEGIDEFTDTWIEGAIDSAVLGKEFNPADLLKESLYSGAVGAGTGAFGGMTDRVTGSINDNALAQQQLYELNTIADQRIQQLQQEVQQDPTRAQAANQEIEDIQNYVQAQTNIILKQAQTGEIREANTNTQLPQFNSQMAQNASNTEEQTATQQNKLPIDTNDKITNFRNSVANENVNDADGFYKSVEKIIKDKDYNVILDSSITNEKGETVNAVISNENGITIRINPKSERAGEILLTHEITHGIETKEMSNLIMDYASKNSEFNGALQDLKKAYGTEDITPEVVADISGQLLGNQEFIKNLSTQKPNIFKQIYDKIIEFANKITGNSKETLFIKDLKNKWEKAYRESNIQTAQQNIKEGAKYSQNAKMTESVDNEGNKLSEGQKIYFKDSKVRDGKGDLTKVFHTTTNPIIQFNEFNPTGTRGYNKKFGNQIVNFYTDSKFMSGSYADQNYEMADTERLNTIEDAQQWLDSIGVGDLTIEGNEVYEDSIDPVLKYKSTKELLRNIKSDIQSEYGNEVPIQYEGYLDIKNPFVVEVGGKDWNEISKELNSNIPQEIEKAESKKAELYKLVEDSKYKNEIYYGNKQMVIKNADKIFSNTTNDNLKELYNDGFIGLTSNYNDFYDKAEENGYDVPAPNTKMRDIIDEETASKITKKEMLDWTIDDCYKKLHEFSEQSKDYGSESSWFYKNYKKIIGDNIKSYYLTDNDWWDLASNKFDSLSKDRIASGDIETNDVVAYIIAENRTKPKNEQYDGVIFKDVMDYAGKEYYENGSPPADVYVTFNSNQFKAADNLDPTSDPDIRYSKKADKWQQWLEENFKNKGTTTVLKDKIGVTTAETVMKDFNEAKKGNLDNRKLRRHVKTSNEATGMEKSIEKADINKITYEVKSNKKLYAKAKSNLEGLSYEEKLARSKNLLNSGKKITDEDIVEAQIVELEAAKAGKIDDYLDMQQDIAIMGTEVGRVVQAMSLIRKMSPDGQIQTLMKIVNRKQKSGNKNYENVKLKPQLVKNVLDAYDDDTHTTFNQEKLDNAMDKLKQDVADQMKVTASEKLNEWRYLSMLGNPKTHVRNIVGNVAMSIVKGIKDIQSAGLQDLLIRNPESKTATLKRASQEVKDLSTLAFNEMMEIDTKGNKYVDTDTIEQKRQIFKPKVLEALRKFNLKALNVEDNIFKKAHFKKSFTSYLTAKGIKTAEDINNNPQIVADAKVYAMQQAKIATFQEENSIASWIKDLDQKGPVARVVRGAVIPFTGVPLNIAKTGIEYTPGIGMGKVISDFKKAPKNQRGNVLIDGLSKQMTGTSLAILGYVLAKSGIVTADAGDDKEDKYLKDLGAKMNYSIKIGDTSYDLSWLSPSSMPFFVGASGYEQWEKKEGIDGNFIFDALASTLDPLSEMSVISSFTDVLSSYNQSEMGKIKDMGESMIQSYSSQFIPTLFSQFARTLDDTKRNTYADKNSKWTFGEETIKKLQYKIPGLRNMLPEQTDYLGNTKKENDNVIKRGIEAFLSPASTKKDTSDKVTKELVKLYDETGDTGVIPGKQDLYIKYQGEKYDLTQREYNQLKRDYGALVNTEVNRAINSNDYQNLSTNEQAEVISNIISYAGFKARNNYMESNGIDYTNSKYNTAKKAEDSGYAIADFYVTKRTLKEDKQNTTLNDVNRYLELKEKGIDGKTFDEFKAFVKSAKATKTANGGYVRGSKKQKIINYINSLPLSASAKKALWDDYNNPNNQGYIQYYK